MALAVWTDSQVLGQLNSGTKWSGTTITYSFPSLSAGMYTGSGEGPGFRAFTDGQKPLARLALQLWDDIIAPDMTEAAAGTSYSSTNLELAFSTTEVSYAHAYFPTVGSVWFNQTFTGGNSLTAPTIGQHGFLTYIHELGHAMGLEHMGEYNGADNNGPSSFQDSTVYSVMSYYGPSWGSGASNGEGQVAWADWVAANGQRYAPQTPMVNDVMAMQAMYGAETTTRTGDTVYGFNSNVTGNTASIYNFSTNLNPILTIVDSAGNDTLDLSGYSTASTIDLAPGAASSANSMTLNIWIARSAVIENARGGSAADIIRGNQVANVLTGNGGNDQLFGLSGDDRLIGGAGSDTIDGGAGIDTAVFDVAWSAIAYSYNSTTMTFTFTGSGWTDTIVNVENFTDSLNVTRTASQLTTAIPPPAPTPSNVSISALTSSVAEGNGGTTANTMQFRVTLATAATATETINWGYPAAPRPPPISPAQRPARCRLPPAKPPRPSPSPFSATRLSKPTKPSRWSSRMRPRDCASRPAPPPRPSPTTTRRPRHPPPTRPSQALPPPTTFTARLPPISSTASPATTTYTDAPATISSTAAPAVTA